MEKHKENLIYLAGLIDGEGNVGSYSKGRGQGDRFHIEIKMTARPVIEWLHETFGGQFRVVPEPREGCKEAYRWRITGVDAEFLYASLQSYLKVK